MSIDPKQVKVISDIADLIYDFLPANPHPYADATVSFPGAAQKAGLGQLWRGGSKRPAVAQLLRDTLEKAKSRFCPLMIEIVNTSILYRLGKKNPVKKEEIEALNSLIAQIGFKIPELWDPGFLNGLPSTTQAQPARKPSSNRGDIEKLREEYVALTSLEPQKRGYAFQDFLGRLFAAYGLTPRSAFRLTGEEIDGSFELNGAVYLLEAKWQAKQTAQDDLAIFSMKVSGKSTWARGLFISYAGYTKDGLEAFARGRQTNIIGMDGQDLFFVLEGKMSLEEAITAKARRAAETNEFFVSVFVLDR